MHLCQWVQSQGQTRQNQTPRAASPALDSSSLHGAHFSCTAAGVTLVIEFFHVTFQDPPLSPDAVCKLLSHSVTGEAPRALSAQLSKVIFNIRDNLQPKENDGKTSNLQCFYTQAALSGSSNLSPISQYLYLVKRYWRQKLPNSDLFQSDWQSCLRQLLSVQCCAGCCCTFTSQTVQKRNSGSEAGSVSHRRQAGLRLVDLSLSLDCCNK